MLKWAFFVSGRGSNMKSLLDGAMADDVALVVSNRRSALALEHCHRRSQETYLMEGSDPWQDLDRALQNRGVNALFLLGFMKIIPKEFVRKWHGSIINVHPSLLPAYPGLKSIERSFLDNAPMGVTVHEVTEEVDAGEIILQEKLIDRPQQSGLSLNELQFRIHLIEHQLIRKAVKLWIPKRI